MMSAITIASSVSGLRTPRTTTAIPSTRATAASAGATSRSRPRRLALTSAPEKQETGCEHEDAGKAEICEPRGPHQPGRIRCDQYLPDDSRQNEADDEADEPCWEERPQDVQGGRHDALQLLSSSLRHALLKSKRGFSASWSSSSTTS